MSEPRYAYEVVSDAIRRIAQELGDETLSEKRRAELRAERERLELKFAELARKGQVPRPSSASVD